MRYGWIRRDEASSIPPPNKTPQANQLLETAEVDDPVGAIGVHGVSALWGLVSVRRCPAPELDTARYNRRIVLSPVSGTFQA